MSTSKWVAALFAVALICLAWPAQAQNARNSHVIWSGAATDTAAVGMADSSSIFQTSKYQRMYLNLKPSRPCRLAIQIRGHGLRDTTYYALADTVNTYVFPWKSYTAAIDTTAFIQDTAPTSVVASDNELVVEFQNTVASKWGDPRGLRIPLQRLDTGGWFWDKFTSIRVRVLSAGGVVVLTGSLEGVGW